MEIISKSRFQTQKLGRLLAGTILQTKPGKQALVLALEGDLGGGKTTFIQGLAAGLGMKQNLTSPTFVVIRSYAIRSRHTPRRVPPKRDFEVFYHIDGYRLKNEKDLVSLGIKEILAEPRNIVAIEWAERVKGILPRDRIVIKFSFVNESTRKIRIENRESIPHPEINSGQALHLPLSRRGRGRKFPIPYS